MLCEWVCKAVVVAASFYTDRVEAKSFLVLNERMCVCTLMFDLLHLLNLKWFNSCLVSRHRTQDRWLQWRHVLALPLFAFYSDPFCSHLAPAPCKKSTSGMKSLFVCASLNLAYSFCVPTTDDDDDDDDNDECREKISKVRSTAFWYTREPLFQMKRGRLWVMLYLCTHIHNINNWFQLMQLFDCLSL